MLRRFWYYLRFLLRGVGGLKASVQMDVICLAVLRIATFDVPRAEPATALAALSHMLSSGFFLVQGFFIGNFLSVDDWPVIGRTAFGQRGCDLFLVYQPICVQGDAFSKIVAALMASATFSYSF